MEKEFIDRMNELGIKGNAIGVRLRQILLEAKDFKLAMAKLKEKK